MTPRHGREWNLNLRVWSGMFPLKDHWQSQVTVIILAHYLLPCYIDPPLSFLGDLFSTQLLGQLIVACQRNYGVFERKGQLLTYPIYGNQYPDHSFIWTDALDAFWGNGPCWDCQAFEAQKIVGQKWINKGCQSWFIHSWVSQPTNWCIVHRWQAWFNKKNVMNLHVGQSPNAGIKCVGFPQLNWGDSDALPVWGRCWTTRPWKYDWYLDHFRSTRKASWKNMSGRYEFGMFWDTIEVTPSVAVSCPMDAGNVRDDEYPDRLGDLALGSCSFLWAIFVS